tara:strand:+ start:784 stop:2307 length:1524 start_codon:yes stop_codon:yes gene_type:complete
MGSLVAELAEKLSSATNNFDIDEGTIYVNTSADTVGIGTTSPGSKFDVQGTMQVGVNDTGHDVKFFGATAGAYLEWDESADELEIRGGAATPGKLLLSTAETTVVDGNEIGRINFQAPLDSAGTDAILVGASIHAEADATFSSSVNSTDLVFSTGDSATAVERMRVSSTGFVGIGVSDPNTALHLKFTDNTTHTADNSSLQHTSGIYINNESTTSDSHASIGFRTNNLDGSVGFVYGGSNDTGRFKVTIEGSDALVIDQNRHVDFNVTGAGTFDIGPNRPTSLAMTVNSTNDTTLVLQETETTKVQLNASGDSYFNGGVVGIGTTGPHSDFKFTVADSSGTGESTYLKFTNATSGHNTGDGFYMGIDGTAAAHLWNQETTAFNIATNNVRRFQIDSNGKAYLDSGYNYGWLRGYDSFVMANGATFNHSNTNSTLFYVYLNLTGQGALYWATYTSTVQSTEGSGGLISNANSGTALRIYKSADSHTTTFSNQTGGDLTITMIVVAAAG